MLKVILTLAVLLSPAIASAQTALTSSKSAAPPTVATDLTNAELQAVLKAPMTGNVYDKIHGLVDAGKYNVAVALVRRTVNGAGGNALSHDLITEVYYVIRGSGTQVTGGTMINPKQTPSGPASVIGPSTGGTDLKGGRITKLVAGDIQIIPPNVPHMFTSIDADGIDYLVFRVDPERVILK